MYLKQGISYPASLKIVGITVFCEKFCIVIPICFSPIIDADDAKLFVDGDYKYFDL